MKRKMMHMKRQTKPVMANKMLNCPGKMFFVVTLVNQLGSQLACAASSKHQE